MMDASFALSSKGTHMIDACPEPAVLFFDVDGTLTSFDPDDMTDKDFSAVRPSQTVLRRFMHCVMRAQGI